MTFYMTYSRSKPDVIVPYAEKHNIGLMTNASHRWSDNTERFLELYDYDTNHVLDSGGYSVMAKYGEYPWTVEEYHDWLQTQSDKFNWVACMDFACEERFDDMYTVEERMDKSFDNIISHFDHDPSYDLLPVLQGRNIEQWVSFYDRLQDHGIPCEYVGLGTVCRLSSSEKIVEVESEIRDRCKNIDRLHGFGVKINSFKLGATFDTTDSHAWSYKARHAKAVYDVWDQLEAVQLDDYATAKIHSFKNYHQYASRLKNKAHGDVQLELPTKGATIDA
jgi:hypothetical protein